MLKRTLRVIARNRVLVDAAINSRQRDVDRSHLRVRAALRGFAQGRVEKRDGFRMVARVVIGEADLDSQPGRRLGIKLDARLRHLVHQYGFERLAVARLHLKRQRERMTSLRQQRCILAC